MCNLSKGVYESGWNKAWNESQDKARLEDIKSIMKNLCLSAEESMEILKIPEEKREVYHKALEVETVILS